MPIIRSKVQPPDFPAGVAVRERVDRLLQDSINDHRVTRVLAAAGSGKTVAVASAARGLGRPLIWISLDQSETVPGRLLTYLEAAIGAATASPPIVADALLAQIHPAEAAGLLAEALPPDVVFVVDNVETLESRDDAWSVLRALIRYSHPSVAFVLVGRRSPSAAVFDQSVAHSVGHVGPDELAVTPDEAEAILRQLGQPTDGAADRVRFNDGWIAGVIYGGATDDHPSASPLHHLLIENILADSPGHVREMLVRTAILSEIDARRAAAVTSSDVGPALETLRQLHLPVSWSPDGATARLHPRLREHALHLFSLLPLDEQKAAHQRHGEMLRADGDLEQAVQEFLQADDMRSARGAAASCILRILERGDLDLADRWIGLFAHDESPARPTEFSIARLFIAFVRAEVGELVRLADAIWDAAAIDDFVQLFTPAGELLAYAYMVGWRPDRFDDVVRLSPDTPGLQAMTYAMSVGRPGKPAAHPPRVNGLLDMATFKTDYYLGRLHYLPPSTGVRITDLLMGPFRIAAAKVSGRTQAALDAYREYSSSIGQTELLTLVGPDILMDAGLWEEALETVHRGRELAERKNDLLSVFTSLLMEAKILLRGMHDAPAAREVLKRCKSYPPFFILVEFTDLWTGIAMLYQEQNEAARDLLRAVVDQMHRYEHGIELGSAAVYLAEAEWRCDNPDGADQAAELALRAAHNLGTNQQILQALSDFPGVITRQLDSAALVDSEWHTIAKELHQGAAYPLVHSSQPQVSFGDLGSATVELLGTRMQPRLTKSFEVLAFLLAQPNRSATRPQLLAALFDDDTAASRTYLRQALKWVRWMLPDGALTTHQDSVGLDGAVSISTDSVRVEQLVAEATRLKGSDRIHALSSALEMLEGRAFLDGAQSRWVLDRRAYFAAMRIDLLLSISRALLDANRPVDAERSVRRALADDPLRETGMRIAHEFHDRDGLIEVFRLCAGALAEVGLEPTQATTALFESLAGR